MKQITLKFRKTILIALSLFLSSSMAMATNFVATSNGDFSSGSTWQGGVAPNQIVIDADDIIINSGVTVTMDQDIEIDNILASLTINGTLEGSKSMNVKRGTISGNGTINIDNLTLNSTGVFIFTGATTVNNFYNSSIIVLKSNIQVKQNLYFMGGILSLDGNINLSDNGSLIFEDGDFALLSGLLNFDGKYNVVYQGKRNKIGTEATGTSLTNLTINLSDNSFKIKLMNDISVNEKLDVQEGVLDINGKNIIVNGSFISSSNGTIFGNDKSDITINGDANSSFYFDNANNTIGNLILNNDDNNQNLVLLTNIQVSGNIEMKKGHIDLNEKGLILIGAFTDGGDGMLIGNSNSNVTLKKDGNIGELKFQDDNGFLSTLTINGGNNTMVELGSELTIVDNLNLTNGKIKLADNDLNIIANGKITGNSKSNYIVTNGNGSLILSVQDSTFGRLFPIGSSDNYSPAIVYNNSDNADFKLRSSSQLLADGSSGSDLSITGKVVNNTWFVENKSSNSSNIDLELMWDSTMEMNSFDRANAYISHYTNNAWDATAKLTVKAEGNAMFSMKRKNITSLSPFSVQEVPANSSVNTLNNLNVSVYPNPTSNFITIEIAKDITSNVSIMDMLGREVIKTNLSNNQIDVSGLKSGIYFIKINGEQVAKFTKQ